MKQKKLLTGLLLFLSVAVSSQNIDSLYSIFQNARPNNRVHSGNILLKELEKQDFANDVLSLANDMPAWKIESEVLLWMANYAFLEERYRETIDFMEKIIRLSEQSEDSTYLETAHYLSGFAYQRLGDMNRALIHSLKSYELCKLMDDEEWLSSVVNNIANIYQANNQDSMAIVFYHESIDIERRLGHLQQLATRLGNLSASYQKQGKLNEALDVVSEALALDRAGTRPDKVALRLTQMADVYKEMEKYREAKDCLEEALAFFEETGSLHGMSIALNLSGEIAQQEGAYVQADEYFMRAAHCAKENGNQYEYKKIVSNIYLLNKERNPAKALKYFEESVALQDSIFGIETQKQINDFHIQYETAKKELEITRQQAVINRQNIFRTILVIGLILTAFILALLWGLLRLRTKRNQELREMNMTKDKFFSIISHDLKNPAIAQRNALQMLVDYGDEWDGAFLKQYGVELLKSSEKELELLYNLLNWAQMQTGRMPYRPSPLNLTKVVETEIDLMRNMIDNKEIALSLQAPKEAVVRGDRNMLATVVRNLLTNAVKFTEKGGKISVEIAEIDAGSYRVNIRDTGIGMSKEQIDELFRLDRQPSKPETAAEPSSGLGLIVCKELLEKHGAALEIESEPGKGSRFGFVIKRA